ncbi:MAG: hypothetical protein QOG71_2471 [Pyrinomonadaceae bacterium]|nr:hypothetical protein [Pyrinomonadaceae bacterium]
MVQKLEKVKAGDLITAGFINSLISQLENLEARVAELEDASSQPGQVVKITGFEFTKIPLRVGHRLEVKGKNFSVPPELNEVFIGGKKVQNFALDSGEDQLVFDVPDIPNLVESGSNVIVKVTNPLGTASDTVKVSPKLIIPQGNIQVTYLIAPVMPIGKPNIEQNSSYIFTFAVKAIASQQGDYTLTPSVIGVQNWTAELLADNGDTVRPSNIITLPGVPGTGATKNIRVRVKVPNSQPNGTKGTVRLAVSENTPDTGVTPGNQQFDITVGSPPPSPETRVRMQLESVQGGAAMGTGANANKVVFKRGDVGIVGLSLEFAVGGSFTVATAVKTPTGWTVGETDVTTFEVAKPAQGQTSHQSVFAEFTAGPTAAETEMYVMIKGTVKESQNGVDIKYAQTIAAV